jgi:hypothetical protein
MKEQNFKNHAKLVTGFHYIAMPSLLVLFIGSIVNLVHAEEGDFLSSSLLLGMCIVLILVSYYARSFALRAQDRAIRAEENFRHFMLTGKPLPSGLRVSQVIALRFASDEEFPSLTAKALSENLTNKQIKEAIQQWRADNYRA